LPCSELDAAGLDADVDAGVDAGDAHPASELIAMALIASAARSVVRLDMELPLLCSFVL
jgi:hypothetical protein